MKICYSYSISISILVIIIVLKPNMAPILHLSEIFQNKFKQWPYIGNICNGILQNCAFTWEAFEKKHNIGAISVKCKQLNIGAIFHANITNIGQDTVYKKIMLLQYYFDIKKLKCLLII